MSLAANLINLTPHAINLMAENETVTLKPSGIIARCATTREQIDSLEIDGAAFPINEIGFGEVQGLPAPKPDTFYIVSSLVAVRDGNGNIIGARALARTS